MVLGPGAVESLVIGALRFWRGKRVFLTGHTGFKGGWLALWLQQLGATVRGYALPPPTVPNLFEMARVDVGMESIVADIRDGTRLTNELSAFHPDVVIHMAAQSLVRESYADPLGTYETNVMGTIALLEAVRKAPEVRVVINVTSDKCYENREWYWGYREIDPMGGFDPYSSSKGCAELVTSAYRCSFFNPMQPNSHGASIASARAGNVIGGGDWAKHRLVPDVMRAAFANKVAVIRNPRAVRPWQHVLEPLRGYLVLAEKLWEGGAKFAAGWNFGPDDRDVQPVVCLLDLIKHEMGQLRWEHHSDNHAPHEAGLLKLDTSKALHSLQWRPVWDLRGAVAATVSWYRAAHEGKDMHAFTLAQISDYAAELL
jgi:CDP-glucose 4,6-dehydratase